MPPTTGALLFPVSTPSDVTSIPCSSNCALFSSSLSPRSPTNAFETLGDSLIKKALVL